MADAVTLPLPPVQPRGQQLSAGGRDEAHLFWIDKDTDGISQLYGALLRAPALTIERGPNRISTEGVFHYVTAADASGGAFVAYSGGQPGEPALTVTGVDAQGRPLPVLDRLRAADMPAFFRMGADLNLSWLDTETLQLLMGTLSGGRIRDVRALMPALYTGAGERLLNMRMGADRTHLYSFWTLERASGTHEVWFSSAAFPGDVWSQPAPLSSQIDLRGGEAVQTGFNSGAASPAIAGGEVFAFATPLAEQGDMLPVLGERASSLVVVYLEGGMVRAEQTVARDVRLLEPPLVVSDRDRNLYAAWSAMASDGVAVLSYARALSRR